MIDMMNARKGEEWEWEKLRAGWDPGCQPAGAAGFCRVQLYTILGWGVAVVIYFYFNCCYFTTWIYPARAVEGRDKRQRRRDRSERGRW